MRNFINRLRVSNKWNPFFLLVILFSFVASPAFSQSLIEKLGGVKTEFVFVSDSKELPIFSQAIIQRGVYDMHHSSLSDKAYGWGYGMQAYRLEFLTKAKLAELPIIKRRLKRKYYSLSLVDGNNTTLLTHKIYVADMIVSTNDAGLTTYSINMNKIPMVVLDKTHTIHIELHKKAK